jgi:hypothetical protein
MLVIKTSKLKKNIKNIFRASILLLFIWIFSGWNSRNHDYNNYIVYYRSSVDYINTIFNNMENSATSIGYYYLNNIFYTLNFTFIEFKIIFSFLCIVLLYKYINTWSACPIICLFIYIISTFFVDVIQMRNTIAYLICFQFLGTLLKKGGKYKIYFILAVLFASTFHIMMLFYLIFIFSNTEKRMNLFLHLFVAFLSMGFIYRLVPSIISILNSGKYEIYNTDSITLFGFVLTFVILFFNMGIIWYYNTKPTMSSLINIEFKKYEYFIYNCNILFLYLLPFSLINMSIIRLYRNFFLFNIIYILNKKKYIEHEIFENSIPIFILYIILMFFAFQATGNIIPIILFNNLLF